MSSSVGMMPAEVYMFRTGSPGERYVSRKVRILMPISTITIWSNREPSCFLPKSLSPLLVKEYAGYAFAERAGSALSANK